MKFWQFLCIIILGLVIIAGCNDNKEYESEIYGQLLVKNPNTLVISPLSDVSCVLYRSDSYPPTGESPYDSTITDSEGIFHFFDVDKGTYIVSIPYILSLNIYEAGFHIGEYLIDYSDGGVKDIGIKTYEIEP